MSTRDEYLQKIKAQLDAWDDDIDKLEEKAREAQVDMQEQYAKQLANMREMRDDAMARYVELQDAAGNAWDALVAGTEKAWHAWLDAFDEARSKFTNKS